MTLDDVEKLTEDSPIVKHYKEKISKGEFGPVNHLNYEKLLEDIEKNWLNEEN